MYKKLILILLSIFFATFCFCQQPQKVSAEKKRLVLKTSYGIFSGNKKMLLSDFLKQINAELLVKDSASGKRLSVVFFELGWKQKDTTYDFNTGKPKNIFTYNAVSVSGHSKIPLTWQKEISGKLQTGEQLIWQNILAQDADNKKIFRAPTITVDIQ